MFQVGPASDVYGFGVTLIQLLMGRKTHITPGHVLQCQNQIDQVMMLLHSGNIQEIFEEHAGNIQGTFREHSGNIQGTFREHSGNIRGIFREQSGNI
jgi:hypothetical protein